MSDPGYEPDSAWRQHRTVEPNQTLSARVRFASGQTRDAAQDLRWHRQARQGAECRAAARL